ncbi:MAG: tubulin-like doman-containing protein [Muribaculaceae bacterium]|nr:tubulin-like doman-containing protein [Muribaculaceae bacterium]
MVPKLKRTLYIGLGGTGFKTLLHTKRAFIETYGEVPPMIKFLVFDSDKNQYKNYSLDSIYGEVKFDPAESSDIMVVRSKDKVSHNRSELSWLPERNLPAVADLENGCGMVRTNGRIAFAFNYRKSRMNIQHALNQICNLHTIHNDKYELISNDVEVNIVFSIAGGTGSGNFLDMAYLVKDIFREQALPETSKIVGYMVLPDVYDAQLNFGKERLYPNGCGSLVDLDYFMHLPFDKKTHVNYLTEQKTLIGSPFNTILAISNRNLNGDTVNHSDYLSQMMSMAMVVTAGELSSGMQSVANNLERDMNSGDYNIANKRAVIGTLGMSEITFRASELSALYREKAARELAAALLNPGSNVNIEANTWIDTEQIRENNGQDQVIDFLLPKNPQSALQEIYDKANPMGDINNYRSLSGVAVNPTNLNAKIDELKSRIKVSFENKIRDLVNSRGPVYADEFIGQVKAQIEICLKEMRDERETFANAVTARESAIKTAVEEYKAANGRFFGKKRAVEEALETLCAVVHSAVVNEREIQRRNGAITFYTWLMQELSDSEQKLNNIVATITSACQILRNNIATMGSALMSPRGMFEIDLTQPYVNQVEVQPSDVNVNQFVQYLPAGIEIYGFDNQTPGQVVALLNGYTSTLNSGSIWESMSVEDALAKLPKADIERIVSRAISLASPMCPLNYRGHLNPTLNNYYYIGVQEQSGTGLKGSIIDIEKCIPAGVMHEVAFSSIGSRDRIVFYHQYGVFPTFAIAGTETYRHAHDNYMMKPLAYSCFIDEDMRVAMEREGFSVLPKEKADNSLELWVKGLIFGLISRDSNGNFQYKDESNDDMALFGYWASLGTAYRDEAFKNFKREAVRLQSQYEEYMHNRSKSEGQDAIDAILADAKINYLEKYSLNDLSMSELTNPLYKGISAQLTSELKYVNKEM